MSVENFYILSFEELKDSERILKKCLGRLEIPFDTSTLKPFSGMLGRERTNMMSLKGIDGKEYVVKLLPYSEYTITDYITKNLSNLCKSYVIKPTMLKTCGPYMVTKQKAYYMYVLILPLIKNDRVARGRWEDTNNAAANNTVVKFKKELLFRMAMGIFCLHSVGVLHSDIKDENFFGKHNHLLLGDFGLSSITQGTKFIIGTTLIGNETIPPQFYSTMSDGMSNPGRGSHTMVDLWGLGMIALQYFVPEDKPIIFKGSEDYRRQKGVTYGSLFGFDENMTKYIPRTITPALIRANIIDPSSNISKEVSRTGGVHFQPFLALLLGERSISLKEFLLSPHTVSFFKDISSEDYYTEGMKYVKEYNKPIVYPSKPTDDIVLRARATKDAQETGRVRAINRERGGPSRPLANKPLLKK